MNAISWIIGHIARHWLVVAAWVNGEQLPTNLFPFVSVGSDPTPISLSEALNLLKEAKVANDWIIRADDELLAHTQGAIDHDENVGTALMRAVLHTWFHTGEINAIRQMLGHSAINFVGKLVGNLEWHVSG